MTGECAAAKAGFSASTGHRIKRDQTLLSQKRAPRGRRRPDPLSDVFESKVVPMLHACPEIRPVAVFGKLMDLHPDLDPNVRRTLERRIRQWRAEHGPDREVIFPQNKTPGRLGLSDFTSVNKLGVSIGGVAKISAKLDDPGVYVDDVFENSDSLNPKRQQDMRMLLRFARRVAQASPIQLRSVAVSHGTFPAACGGVIGPFESEKYAPWGDMLARWAEEFLEFVG